MDRRRFLTGAMRSAAGAALLGGGASALLDACGSGGSGGSGTTKVTFNSQSGISQATPRRGGSITVGMNSEVTDLLPSASHYDNTGYTYASTIFDTLAYMGTDKKPHPYLAESITPNADYSAWTITLRPGIKFHDGTPLDATALKANIDNVSQNGITSLALQPVASTTIVGPMAVRVNLKQPVVSFAAALTTQVGFVVSPAYIEAHKKNANATPVGTGPFIFKEHVENVRFVATRNPDYWRKGLPYLDQITYTPIVNEQSRLDSLRAGSVDMMVSIDPNSAVTLAKASGFQVVLDRGYSDAEPSQDFILLNCAVSPTDDLRVRQAMAYAMNTKQIIQDFGAGLSVESDGLFPKGSPYYAPSHYPQFDPAKAKSLVNEYSAQHGAPTVELVTVPDPRLQEATTLIAAQWGNAGIKTTTNTVDQTTLVDNAITGKFQAATWELFSNPDPDLNYIWWSPTTAAPVGQVALNFSRNKDPLIEKALQIGRTNPDPAVRAKAYQDVNDRLSIDLPYLWIELTIWVLGADPRVQNFNNVTLPSGAEAQPFHDGQILPGQIWVTG